MGLNIYITCISIILSYLAYKYNYYDYTSKGITYMKEFCYENWIRHKDKCYFASLHKVSWKDGFDRCNLVGARMLNKSIIYEDRMPIQLYKNHWLDKTTLAIFVKDEDNCEYIKYDGKDTAISTILCNSSMFYACVADIIKV
ncbi:C-type lectin-like protein [Mudlarkpox virus]|nr:C-type lectin-like protein [Cheloniid poxvirus 1]QRM15305.1 C-type lectin-like protein [Mudlarkpox virus]